MRSPIYAAALAAVSTLVLTGCVTGGMDAETRAALQATLESVQELTDLWQERLDDLDGGSGTSAQLQSVGTNQTVGGLGVIPDRAMFTGWGYWGKNDDGTTLFRATITAGADLTDDIPENAIYVSSVTGLRAFDNPEEVDGSATWSGKVRGVDRADFAAITGNAEIEYDFTLDWVDVRFDRFSDARLPLTWSNIPVFIGRFRRGVESVPSVPFVEGTFYGDEHEGVAGKFRDGNLRGIFGALRE